MCVFIFLDADKTTATNPAASSMDSMGMLHKDGSPWRGGIYTPITSFHSLLTSPRRAHGSLDMEDRPSPQMSWQADRGHQGGEVRLVGLTYNKAYQMTHHTQPVRGATVFHFVGSRKQDLSLEEDGWRWSISSGAGGEGSGFSRNVSSESLAMASVSSALSSIGHAVNLSLPTSAAQKGSRGGGRSDAGGEHLPLFTCVFADQYSLPESPFAVPTKRSTPSTSISALLERYMTWSVVEALGIFVRTCPLPRSRTGGGTGGTENAVQSALIFFLPQVRTHVSVCI